jgi:hypothetical protein
MMGNSIQIDALAQPLIEKELISEDEFQSELREVITEYESKGKGKV